MQGRDEYLGMTKIKPTVRLDLGTPAPHLEWFKIDRYGDYTGDLLAAFELLLDEGGELPSMPPKASPPHVHYTLPQDISPKRRKTRIEVCLF